MKENKVIRLTSEEVQAEVNDLYEEIARHYGHGFADFIIGKYTDVVVKKGRAS